MPKRRRKSRKPAPKSRPRKASAKPRPWKQERRVYIFDCATGGHTGRTYSRAKARQVLCRKCERKRQHPDQLDIFGKTVGERQRAGKCPKCGDARVIVTGNDVEGGYVTTTSGAWCETCQELEVREETSVPASSKLIGKEVVVTNKP